MRCLWILLALFVTVAQSSYAMLKSKARELPPEQQLCCFDSRWTGFTMGLNAGGLINATDGAVRPGGDFLLPANVANNPQRTDLFDMHGGAFVGGVQIGYNYQMKVVVIGVETDFNYCSLSRSHEKTKTLVAPLSGNFHDHVSQLFNWFGTFRPRFGLAFKPVLIYATGGLAYGHVTSKTTATFSAAGDQYAGSRSKWPLGWTVGAGIEWGFTRGWSTKLEYLFVDLRKVRHTDNNVPPPNFPTFSYKTSMKTEGHILRIGFNYTI